MNRVLPLAWVVLLGVSAGARADDEFLISFWYGPPKAETNLKRYQEIADCGFTAVLPPGGGGDVDNKAILDLCKQTGMKAILADGRLLAKQPKAPDFASNLDAVVADYAGHPALAGYFLTDEPSAAAFTQLGAVSQYLRKKDPKRLPYINLFPNYATPQQLGTRTYEEYLRQFINTVQPPLLSWDHYALLRDGPSLRPEYFANLEAVRKQATAADLPFAQIILSVPHLGYRDPTEADLRWQVFTTLAYGAKGVLYFTYWTPFSPEEKKEGYHDAIINARGERTPKYDQVKRLNARVRALAPTLLKLRPVAAYHTAAVPQGAEGLDPKGPISRAVGGELLLGWLKDDKNDYLFLVNRSLKKKSGAQITLAKPAREVEELSQEKAGEVKKANFVSSRRLLDTSLEPGEGRLFVVKR
jgi:hypothetical protein